MVIQTVILLSTLFLNTFKIIPFIQGILQEKKLPLCTEKEKKPLKSTGISPVSAQNKNPNSEDGRKQIRKAVVRAEREKYNTIGWEYDLQPV